MTHPYLPTTERLTALRAIVLQNSGGLVGADALAITTAIYALVETIANIPRGTVVLVGGERDAKED